MKVKSVAGAILLTFAVVSIGYVFIKEQSADTVVASNTAHESLSSHEALVVAYYFHGNVRCPTCRTIEAYARQAILSSFPDAVRTGRIEFRAVNVQTSQNEHFIRDYRLTAPSVVIARFEGGSQRVWKNLNQVWYLVGDKETFMEYVRDETMPLMGESR